MARRTLLLDLDGTLWDSRPWYAEILAMLGCGSATSLNSTLASGASVVQVASECGVSKSRVAREARNSVATLPFYNGVLRTLEDLTARTTTIGVVTNLPGWLVRPVVQAAGISGHFRVIVTPRPGVPAKPKPHGIRRALQMMRRQPGLHTWLVGDGFVDAEAAAASGLRFAWASYGYETVRPEGTEVVLSGFEEVLDL